MDSFQKNILQFNRQLGFENLEFHNGEKLRRRKSGKTDCVVICGMGGSGLAGEILKGTQKETGHPNSAPQMRPSEFSKLPIIIWKNYGIPEHNFKNPLYIFVSFSGNTEETLSGLQLFLKTKRGAAAVVTSGGELKKLGNKHSFPMVVFPAGDLTPRQATGKMFYGIATILQNAGFELKVPEFTNINPRTFESSGKALARRFFKKLIVIYTDERHRCLGYIWKIKFNETAKIPAFNNVLPEMNHNETVGFGKTNFPVAALFLRDKTHRRTEKRFTLTEKLLREKGVSIVSMKLNGKTGLEKTWRTIILADWTTYFLAKLNRVDPAETKIIEKLKTLMR